MSKIEDFISSAFQGPSNQCLKSPGVSTNGTQPFITHYSGLLSGQIELGATRLVIWTRKEHEKDQMWMQGMGFTTLRFFLSPISDSFIFWGEGEAMPIGTQRLFLALECPW